MRCEIISRVHAGHCGQYVDGEPVGARHVHGNEFNIIAVHQAKNEMDVAGKPVTFGDYKDGTALPALSQGGMDLGPVILAPAFHFDELRGQVALACHEAGHSLALRIHAEPFQALLVGGYSVVSNIFGHFQLPVLFSNVRSNEYTMEAEQSDGFSDEFGDAGMRGCPENLVSLRRSQWGGVQTDKSQDMRRPARIERRVR